MTDKTKKILLTGASGYLGPYVISELLKKQNEAIGIDIFAIYNNHPLAIDGISSLKCDISRRVDLEKIFTEINPTTVIHLASGTPTRISGQPDEYIKQINVDATEQIAKLCASNGALMIYTSSDLVYESGINLNEDSSKLNPLTIYAQTKLEGEDAVRKFSSNHIIFRTALIYGFTRSTYESFFDSSYAILNAGKSLRAFTDQYRNAIYIEDTAAIIALMPFLYKSNDIINLCGDEYLSRYDMCIGMSEIFGFEKNLIIPGSTDEFTQYPMVKHLGLNCAKLKKLGFETRPFRQNLLRAMNYKPAK